MASARSLSGPHTYSQRSSAQLPTTKLPEGLDRFLLGRQRSSQKNWPASGQMWPSGVRKRWQTHPPKGHGRLQTKSTYAIVHLAWAHVWAPSLDLQRTSAGILCCEPSITVASRPRCLTSLSKQFKRMLPVFRLRPRDMKIWQSWHCNGCNGVLVPITSWNYCRGPFMAAMFVPLF